MSRATQDTTRYKPNVVYRIITFFDRFFQSVPLSDLSPHRSPTTPIMPKHHWFGLLRVRSPLLAQSLFVFFSYRYLDVSVPCVRPIYMVIDLQSIGLPHSETCGSKVICTSPQLIAAYRVLLRLREPRHPPFALSYFFLILDIFQSRIAYCMLFLYFFFLSNMSKIFFQLITIK